MHVKIVLKIENPKPFMNLWLHMVVAIVQETFTLKQSGKKCCNQNISNFCKNLKKKNLETSVQMTNYLWIHITM